MEQLDPTIPIESTTTVTSTDAIDRNTPVASSYRRLQSSARSHCSPIASPKHRARLTIRPRSASLIIPMEANIPFIPQHETLQRTISDPAETPSTRKLNQHHSMESTDDPLRHTPMLRSTNLPPSPCLNDSTVTPNDLIPMSPSTVSHSCTSCFSPNSTNSQSGNTYGEGGGLGGRVISGSRRCSTCSTSTSFHIGHISHASITNWSSLNSPDSTLPSTPEGTENQITRSDLTADVLTAAAATMNMNEDSPSNAVLMNMDNERHKAEMTADLYNALRNPCHQLLAFVDLLDNSPTFAGLVEEKEFLRTIRAAAGTIRSIVVDGSNASSANVSAANSRAGTSLGYVSNHSPLPSSIAPTPISQMQHTPPQSHNGSNVPKSASAHTSPQQLRLPPSAPPSAPPGGRSLARSLLQTSSPPTQPQGVSIGEIATARIGISRTPPLPAATGFRSASNLKFDLSQLSILIVDDMSLNRKVLRKMLESIPSVDVASDGLEAINLVRTKLEQHAKIKLPPIPNLEQLMKENETVFHAHCVTEPSPNGTPIGTTPCGTPTPQISGVCNFSGAVPTTPMMLASPEALSPSHARGLDLMPLPTNSPHRVGHGPVHHPFELPSAEDKVERHHSFPTPTFLPTYPSSTSLSTNGVAITQHGWGAQQVSSSPPHAGHQQQSTGIHISSVIPPPISETGMTSPLSPHTPLIVPATPCTPGVLSPTSARRHSVPQSKAPMVPGQGQLLMSGIGSKAQYDVIVTDLSMPKLSGHQEAALIRQLEQEFGLPPVPIIAVSSNTLLTDRMACARSDITYFLSKPFTRRDILGLLELIVHERSQAHHSLAGLKRSMSQCGALAATLGVFGGLTPPQHATPPMQPQVTPGSCAMPMLVVIAGIPGGSDHFSMLPAAALTHSQGDDRPSSLVERKFSISAISSSPPSDTSSVSSGGEFSDPSSGEFALTSPRERSSFFPHLSTSVGLPMQPAQSSISPPIIQSQSTDQPLESTLLNVTVMAEATSSTTPIVPLVDEKKVAWL